MSYFDKVKNITRDELAALIEQHSSLSTLLRAVGSAEYDARSRSHVLSRLAEWDLKWNRTGDKLGSRFTEDQLRNAVTNSICWSDVLRQLNLKAHGRNANTIKGYIDRLGIDVSHFDFSKAVRRGKESPWTYDPDNPSCLNEIGHRSVLRRVVLKYKLVEYKCVSCGNEGSWLNKPITLELDHIDGDSTNNNLENLRFLCPNCHSQTETFGRKNK